MKQKNPAAQKKAGTDIPHLQRPPPIKEFRKMVLGHYRGHGRDLPWRKTSDPYHILVSEIMLQQTQVERVAVKYPVFVAAFPDFPSLAEAPLAEILAAWQGMGYNRRAISLQKCSRRVVEEFDGVLPQDPEILATFPGIGRATAASICAFAFNMPVIFIETNIRRVFIHFFFENATAVGDADILPLAKKALYRKDPRTWYNALMDLGTDIRSVAGNPNRRSRHYAKQAAFEGSDRKIRGSIIRALLAREYMTPDGIVQEVGEETGRTSRILADLEEEGFIIRTGRGYSIASR
jgi:A/G-specific adenine glycosylase